MVYLLSLYYWCFTCFVSTEIGKAKCTIWSLRLTLNYNVCTVIFCLYSSLWCKHFYPQPRKNTFIGTENTNLNGIFFKSKAFPFMHERKLKPRFIYKFFSIKLSADISHSFLFSVKSQDISKLFSSNSFLIFNRF